MRIAREAGMVIWTSLCPCTGSVLNPLGVERRFYICVSSRERLAFFRSCV